MLLPRIAWGRLEEAPVSGAARPASSCVHCLAASLAAALVPAARTKMDTLMCSSPWLGTAPVAELHVPSATPVAELHMPSATPYCWLGLRAEGWPWHVLVFL